METIPMSIARMRVALGAVPEEKRRADWRIANGLVREAVAYHTIGQARYAREMLKAAEPYFKEAMR